jgi:Domain of unknown function (DUF4082)
VGTDAPEYAYRTINLDITDLPTVSYYAPNGGYAADGNYFAVQHDSGTLHAPAANNGVYNYGTASS